MSELVKMYTLNTCHFFDLLLIVVDIQYYVSFRYAA